jgi:hypothetical protein
LGNYKECTEIYYKYDNLTLGDVLIKPVMGRYCRANIGFPLDQLPVI